MDQLILFYKLNMGDPKPKHTVSEKKGGVEEDRTIRRKLYIDTSRSLSRRPTPRELRTYRERVDVSAVALLERVVVLPPAGHASSRPFLPS